MLGVESGEVEKDEKAFTDDLGGVFALNLDVVGNFHEEFLLKEEVF